MGGRARLSDRGRRVALVGARVLRRDQQRPPGAREAGRSSKAARRWAVDGDAASGRSASVGERQAVNVVEWAETNWIVPETKRPVRLKLWQKAVLLAMFPADGSLSRFETFLISTVKKAGKTTLNAIASLYAALTLPAPETVYCVANDLAQAQERVFDLIAKQVRAQGLV